MTAGALAGAEGGAARPDNVLRGGAVLLMAPRCPRPVPSDEEDEDAADAATVSQKKKQGTKARKERRDAADGQDGSQTEEHAENENLPDGTEGRPAFKDLKCVSKYTDKVFIGKLAKQSFIFCVLFMCTERRKECGALIYCSSFTVQMDCLADKFE